MSPSPVEELALTDLDRSNKGASKQRRDLINAEIAVMRDLLPLPESARQRLSQLQIMSLSCVYIRKCNVLHKLFSPLPVETDVPITCDFSQALTGFLLITTREGKLVYISENVTDYLGHSMVDMKTQGDSLYDIVDKRDHSSVQAHLLQGGAEPDLTRDVAFFCRMNMSRTLKRQAGFGDVKVMHVRGHFLPLSDPSSDQQQQQQQPQKYAFMATCSPLITPELKETLIHSNTMVFKTVHQLDMTFLEVTKTAEFHLGCTTEEICKKSWYSMLHPEDIHEAKEKHVLLMRANHELSCMMTVRMLTSVGSIVWVNVVMHVSQSSTSQTDDALIVCINQVISEEEAFQIRMQSHMFTLYPPRSTELWSTSTLSHPKPAQPDPAFWMPATSPMVSSIPGFSYPTTPCPALSQQHHVLPTADFISGHDGTSYQISPPSSSPSSTSTAMLSSSVQTDKLKLMLKRKLQGPCHQAKVPKMAWDETVGNISHRQSMESTSTADPMRSSQSRFMISGNSPRGYSWPGSTQVVPHAQYRVAHNLPVAIAHRNNVKAALSPSPASLPTVCRGTEQVVPENEVAVPESFLTPDPSPATSPNPQTSGNPIKTELQMAPTSAVILKELEKLVDVAQAKTTPAVISKVGPCMKKEKTFEECRHVGRQKELPVIDAFDIESFFHTLDFGQQLAAEDKEVKNQQHTTSDVSAAALERVSIGKSPAPTASVSNVKQEPSDTSSFPLPTTCASQQQQLQVQTKKADPRQQSEVDPREFEELLSYFSGEMTATQLSLDSLLSSSMSWNEAGELDLISQQEDKHTSQPCDEGHVGSFLLCSATLGRAQEGFSPVSSSDMSGDEDSCSEESTELKPVTSVTGPKSSGQLKLDSTDMHGCTSFSGPSPTPVNNQAIQDVPGINEEDELYQLNKLLSLMASDNGLMLSEESQ